ncbi:hypothetical protein PMAYCL1PPCAC_20261, partial [Pristionchus mayeri]
VNAVKSLTNLYLEKQSEIILDKINGNPGLRLLICYSGKDHLIETPISEEFTAEFKDRTHKVCADSDDENAVASEIEKCFLSDATRRISVSFPNDNHFAQKKRADLIARGVIAIAKSTVKASL